MNRTLFLLLTASLMLVAACTGQGSEGHIPPTLVPTATTTTDPAQASRQAAADKARQDEVTAHLNEITARAMEKPTLDEQLAVFVTAYCQLRDSGTSSTLISSLENRYEKFWRAGHQWNRPLTEAAKQQGACPLPPPPTPYPKR